MKFSSRLLFGVMWATSLLFLMPVATGFQAVNPGENSAELWVDYNNAVSDSAIYRPERIHALFPLQVNGDSGKATVVTLTDWNYPKGEQSLTQAVWVTVAPEVENKCRTFKDKDLALRLRQLLGLQPDAKVAHFVTMSVDYRDVFRPALNPIATTALLCDAQRDKKCGETFPDWISDEHRRWITQQMLDSYMVLTPPSHCCSYPWTRLGYTYDWKRGEVDKYGASEYVVRPGALVNVQESRDYAAFCRARD